MHFSCPLVLMTTSFDPILAIVLVLAIFINKGVSSMFAICENQNSLFFLNFSLYLVTISLLLDKNLGVSVQYEFLHGRLIEVFSKVYNSISVGFLRFLNFKVLLKLQALIISSHELTEIPSNLFISIQSTFHFLLHQFLLFFHDEEYSW